MIDPKLFSNKNDQVALHAAYLKAREIFQTSSREGHISYVELLPGPLLNHAISLPTFVEFASWIGTTYFHICGTCPMDRYANGMVQSFGVVSDNLQVKGIDNLSIADASVFPAIPSFPTAKLSMIVGARAADFLCSNSSEGTQLLKNSRPKVKAKMQL
jgi:choline dehydrogenase